MHAEAAVLRTASDVCAVGTIAERTVRLYTAQRMMYVSQCPTPRRSSCSFYRQLLLGERHPVARTDREDIVVEVVMRIVNVRGLRAIAGAEPYVTSRLRLQHERKVFAAHLGCRIRVDVVGADDGCRCRGRVGGFPLAVDGG